MKRICEFCGGHLVLIGTDRVNGKPVGESGTDWESRSYHKKCYKEVKRGEALIEQLRLMKMRKQHRAETFTLRSDILRVGETRPSSPVLPALKQDASTQTLPSP